MTDTKKIEDLDRELTELQGEVQRLREELAGEVRTRRLVVVDEANVERITAQVNDGDEHPAEVRLSGPCDEAAVVLYAGNNVSEERGEDCGWVLSARGDTVAHAVAAANQPDRVHLSFASGRRTAPRGLVCLSLHGLHEGRGFPGEQSLLG